MKVSMFLVITLLAITSCDRRIKTIEYQLSRDEQIVNQILYTTAAIIKKTYHLNPCGEGASMPGGPIKKLALCFDTRSTYNVEYLRFLLIKSAQELLKQVNENGEIQEFLKEPFTIRNIEIIIYNKDKQRNNMYYPGISTAQITNSILIYKSVDSPISFSLKNKYEETYEEALEIIEKS